MSRLGSWRFSTNLSFSADPVICRCMMRKRLTALAGPAIMNSRILLGWSNSLTRSRSSSRARTSSLLEALSHSLASAQISRQRRICSDELYGPILAEPPACAHRQVTLSVHTSGQVKTISSERTTFLTDKGERNFFFFIAKIQWRLCLPN